MSAIYVSGIKMQKFINSVLIKNGARKDVAASVSKGLVQTSLRGVDSHGVRLLPHYLAALKGGRINGEPDYKFNPTSASTGILDADHTFGHAAGIEAARKAVKMAAKSGTGHVAVCNSTHFGAAAFYALEIAHSGMIGMAFTNTDALVKSYGGKKPFLGNNPIAFAAPCQDEEPFCLDMATSIVTFNKIRQLREAGAMAPGGVGADKDGLETTDPHEITMLLPIGAYKGYGLSMVIEILCSLLTGMPYGPHIPKMFEAPISAKRFLGHFIIAMKIDCFQKKSVFKKRLSGMMNELRSEPPLKAGEPVRVAGDPEKDIFKERVNKGIPLSSIEYESFKELAAESGLLI